MKFQVPIHLSVAAILVLALLGAGVIVAQSGVQQTLRTAAPAPSSCGEGSASLNTALPATPDCGGCDAPFEEPAFTVSQAAAAETGCCGTVSAYPAYPAENTGCGTGAPGHSSIPAVFEDISTPAPGSGGCCGTPPATNGSPNVIAASP